MKIENRK